MIAIVIAVLLGSGAARAQEEWSRSVEERRPALTMPKACLPPGSGFVRATLVPADRDNGGDQMQQPQPARLKLEAADGALAELRLADLTPDAAPDCGLLSTPGVRRALAELDRSRRRDAASLERLCTALEKRGYEPVEEDAVGQRPTVRVLRRQLSAERRREVWLSRDLIGGVTAFEVIEAPSACRECAGVRDGWTTWSTRWVPLSELE